MNTRLEKFYKENVVPALMKEFGYTNPMEVPKLVKVTLNMGVGEAATNKKILENAVADMAKISGQKPVVTKSRVSVASFKIRDGWPIGCKTTLRRAKMYEFLDRLINISLPRVRDFRGVSGRSFDGRGNFNMGVKEQIIFPEIDFDAVDAIRAAVPDGVGSGGLERSIDGVHTAHDGDVGTRDRVSDPSRRHAGPDHAVTGLRIAPQLVRDLRDRLFRPDEQHSCRVPTPPPLTQ